MTISGARIHVLYTLPKLPSKDPPSAINLPPGMKNRTDEQGPMIDHGQRVSRAESASRADGINQSCFVQFTKVDEGDQVPVRSIFHTVLKAGTTQRVRGTRSIADRSEISVESGSKTRKDSSCFEPNMSFAWQSGRLCVKCS